MQKRGDFKVGPIIIAIVVIVVLVILFTSVIPWIAGKDSFFKFNFKDDDSIKNELDILRYDLSQSKLEYYDGNKFQDFSGKKIKLKEKTIDYDTTKKIIEKHITNNIDLVIYNGELKLVGPKIIGNDVEIKLKQKEEIKNNGLYYITALTGESQIYYRYLTDKSPSLGWEWSLNGFSWFNTYSIETTSCKAGETNLGKNNCENIKKLRDLDKIKGANFIYNKGNSLPLRDLPYNGESIIFGNDGALYWKSPNKENRENLQLNEGLYASLFKEEAEKWRKSVLKKPISLIIDTGEGFVGPTQPFYICSELIDNKYLVLKTSKEVASNYVC